MFSLQLELEIVVAIIVGLLFSAIIIRKVIVKKKAPAYVQTVSQDHDLEITDFDEFHSRVLVLDESHKKLLFTWIGHTREPIVVDLTKILSCKVGKETSVHSGLPHVNRLELILKARFHQGEDIHLTLYVRHGEGLIEESQLYNKAKKWASRIEEIIKKTTKAA